MKARPINEYHEDMGDVLWWKFPITEAPYVGRPTDLGFTVQTHINITMITHVDPEGEENEFITRRDDDWWHDKSCRSVGGVVINIYARLKCHGCGIFFSVVRYVDGETHSTTGLGR